MKDKDGKATTDLKPEEDWSKEEDELALGNSKALNALFNEVDKNIFSALGEKMLEEKPVRKILRSLPKKSDMKVTVIEEAQDISNMRVDELVGSLQTFELGISDRSEKKNKIMSFVSNTEDEEDQCDLDIDEGMYNVIVLLKRQFNKVRKGMDRKSRPNVKNISYDISKNRRNAQSRKRYLKKQKKGLSVSSFDDSEGETDDETTKHVTAFTGRYEFDKDSCDEGVSYEALVASYKELCVRSE
ncbi:uncharacterized protein LOC127079260 [Lathyrus oleraceus]|uniref:uncharacterized protein LOC127079260 n=1 Tax=Pisum sativum TaxID=3888 RepID=UPI0021D1A858|nr:uncharacterized protein LOC127079260 [Pisum sativum]